MGRTSGLSAEVHEAIIAEVRKGVPLKWAAQIHGFPRTTIYRWTRQGRADLREKQDTIYARFVTDVCANRGAMIRDLIDVVTEAAKGKRNWFAALRMLEMLDPESFGRDRDQKKKDDEKPADPTGAMSAAELQRQVLADLLASNDPEVVAFRQRCAELAATKPPAGDEAH